MSARRWRRRTTVTPPAPIPQVDLFGVPPAATVPSVPAPPVAAGSDTSRRAASTVAPTVGRLRDLVEQVIRDAGPRGLTRPEIAVAAHLSENTARPRVWELLLMEPSPLVEAAARRDGCSVLVHRSHAE